jgi:hypothetical protein
MGTLYLTEAGETTTNSLEIAGFRVHASAYDFLLMADRRGLHQGLYLKPIT